MSTEPWELQRFPSYSDAKMALFDYIEGFYNQRRRHSTLGQISPAAFERRAAAPEREWLVAAAVIRYTWHSRRSRFTAATPLPPTLVVTGRRGAIQDGRDKSGLHNTGWER